MWILQKHFVGDAYVALSFYTADAAQCTECMKFQDLAWNLTQLMQAHYYAQGVRKLSKLLYWKVFLQIFQEPVANLCIL